MINVRTTVVAVALGGLVWTSSALAQVDEKARQILQESTDALSKVQSIEYSARRYGTGSISIIDFSGDARIIRSAMDKNRCPMHLKGHGKSMGAKPDAFWYSTDGAGKVTIVDADNKLVYRDWPLDQKMAAMNQKSQGDQIIHDAFFSTEPYKNDLAATKVEVLPSEDFKGEMCAVVKASRDLPRGDGKSWTTWHISTKDHLPRRHEQGVTMGENNINLITELWDVRVNPGLKLTDLAIATPEGFQDKVWVPPQPVVQQPANPDQPAAVPVPPPVLGIKPGNIPPDFSLKTADGATVTRDGLRGQPTVLAFLWSRSGASGRAAPILNDLSKTFGNVKVYGVMSHEKADGDATAFAKDKQLAFPVLLGGDKELETAYEVKGFPAYYVIGADGKVVGFHQGSNDEQTKQQLEKLLGQATGGGEAAAAGDAKKDAGASAAGGSPKEPGK